MLWWKDLLVDKKIFREKPDSTWDNFFSGDGLYNWVGLNGFGITTTCRRDRFPSDIPKKYLHIKKTDTSIRTKVGRFTNPIVAVKQVTNNDVTYERAHILFQSTSSCNIATVNALNSCNFYVKSRERGRNDNKRNWVIEMNDARSLYLASYGCVDNMDKLVKFCRMKMCSWKYWHASMLHVKALVCAVAYDVYIECTEGKLKKSWEVKSPMTFWQFRDKLGQQLLSYDPRFNHYPGDEKMRSFTSMNQTQRRKTTGGKNSNRRDSNKRPRHTTADEDSSSEESDKEESDISIVETTTADRVTLSQLKQAKEKKNSRLCGPQNCLMNHICSIKKIKCAKQCEICGIDAYTVCTLCPGTPGLHFFPQKGIAKGKQCFMHFHSDEYFGLTKSDTQLYKGMRNKDWKPPTKRLINSNTKHIKELTKQLLKHKEK